MKLIAFLTDGQEIDIRPAPSERDWMDRTNQRFAYRCLPLTIANAYGWELCCLRSFTAVWNGKKGLDAIKIAWEGSGPTPAVSHFGHGVLTFRISCLFRTEPGYDLMVQGPTNRPKDAIAPLSGIVETDWSPFTFTMNWLFTRRKTKVTFEQGEPFCTLFPIRRGDVETVEPEFRELSSDPDLAERYTTWRDARLQFNADLKELGSVARQQKWQKSYHRGLNPDGTAAIGERHRTRIKLHPFRRNSKS